MINNGFINRVQIPDAELALSIVGPIEQLIFHREDYDDLRI